MDDRNGRQEAINAFSNSIDPNILDGIIQEEETSFKTNHQERIIIVVAEIEGRELGSQLFDLVATKSIQEAWRIESLTPVPLLSKVFEQDAHHHINNLFNELQLDMGTCRVVAAIGGVSYGGIGTSYHMSYGSYGPIVRDVMEACFALSKSFSWIDRKVSSMMNIKPIEWVKINSREFGNLGENWGHHTSF